MTWYRNVKRVEDSRWNAGFGALVVLLLEPWHEVLVCIDGQLQPSTFSCTSPDSSSDGFHGYMEWTYILHVSYMFKPSMCEIKWCSRMFFPSKVYPHILIPLNVFSFTPGVFFTQRLEWHNAKLSWRWRYSTWQARRFPSTGGGKPQRLAVWKVV